MNNGFWEQIEKSKKEVRKIIDNYDNILKMDELFEEILSYKNKGFMTSDDVEKIYSNVNKATELGDEIQNNSTSIFDLMRGNDNA